MTQEQLKALKAATDAILDAASKEPPREWAGQAINWGDLSCVEAVWVRTDEGLEQARILIEEVDDCAIAFQDDVAKRLTLVGWPDVVVQTSW